MANDQVPPKDRLKRFLYVSNEHPKFIVGDAENHNCYEPAQIKCITEILQSQNPEILLNVVEIVNSENLTTRREAVFFVLALAARADVTMQKKEAFKQKLYTTLLNVCKNDDDLFLFIKFFTKQQKSFPSSLIRTVNNYYAKKDPKEFARNVTEASGYHGWKHKDVIKLCHCKSENVLTSMVFKYVLFGLKKVKECNTDNADVNELIEYWTKVENFKRCEDERKVAELLPQLKFSIKQVPSQFSKSKIVWEALIPIISLDKLMSCLPQLYKLGFLKGAGSLQSKVVEAFTNVERIRQSKMHPVEFFIGFKNFEKGGKPLDPKLIKYLEEKEESVNGAAAAAAKPAEEGDHKKIGHVEAPKCQPISSALNKAVNISYNNLHPTGKRFMITIDMSDKMDLPCLRNKNLSCIDAAIILLLCIIKTEREVTVAVFNDTKVSLVSFEKSITFFQALTKLRQAKKGMVIPSAVFEWAINKKKHIDVFINVFFYHHWHSQLPKEIRDKEKPLESLNKYRKKMNLSSKLINMSLSTPHLGMADGSSNILDICGFDAAVPKVIEAFCRGSFY